VPSLFVRGLLILGNVAVLAAEHVNARHFDSTGCYFEQKIAARIRIIDPWLEHYIAAVF
jgi:hypothetical protein